MKIFKQVFLYNIPFLKTLTEPLKVRSILEVGNSWHITG